MATRKPNQFEARGRARKVAAILATVPTADTREGIEGAANWLAELSVADRNVLAAAAGVNEPSEETWREVVAGARARRTADEIFARIALAYGEAL